mgnify:FL=1
MNLRIIFFLIIFNQLIWPRNNKTDNVILITLDGVRWEDVFTGADRDLYQNKDYVKDFEGTKEYWVDDYKLRREKLMPFMWKTIAKEGQLYGNVEKGSVMELKNPHWFSYPSYSEILVGYVDPTRNSNASENNPNVTVLEFIHNQPGFKNRVAAFCSWDVFDYIINEERAGFVVNSGQEEFHVLKGNRQAELINKLMFKIPVPWASVRFDAFTFYLSFNYLKAKKPRLLYLAFDGTDEYAHDGQYDQYLYSMNRLDGYIKSIWDWVQSNSGYRNKTTMIITTDHGRGDKILKEWRSHGSSIKGSKKVWLAIIGPDTPSTGEIENSDPVYSTQIAMTIARLLDVDYKNKKEVGTEIKSVFK